MEEIAAFLSNDIFSQNQRVWKNVSAEFPDCKLGNNLQICEISLPSLNDIPLTNVS